MPAQYKKLKVIIWSLVVGFILILTSEVILEKLYGLGNPVLYDSNPFYGYRPQPNREYHRFHGTEVKTNNLGLRAEQDWDGKQAGKILFLGDSITFGGSYVGNRELFSYLATKDLKGYRSGNAGVNGWSIDNIYGLVVESNFVPAEVYVTTVVEGHLYAGLSTMTEAPFYNKSPRFALLELWYHFCFGQNMHRYLPWSAFYNEKEMEVVLAERGISKLKSLADFFAQHNLKHLLFISPTADQVIKGAAKDALIVNALNKYKINYTYIMDELPQFKLSEQGKKDIFHDHVHINQKGHELWAGIIRSKLAPMLTNDNETGSKLSN